MSNDPAVIPPDEVPQEAPNYEHEKNAVYLITNRSGYFDGMKLIRPLPGKPGSEILRRRPDYPPALGWQPLNELARKAHAPVAERHRKLQEAGKEQARMQDPTFLMQQILLRQGGGAVDAQTLLSDVGAGKRAADAEADAAVAKAEAEELKRKVAELEAARDAKQEPTPTPPLAEPPTQVPPAQGVTGAEVAASPKKVR